jgi:hypothetical protein
LYRVWKWGQDGPFLPLFAALAPSLEPSGLGTLQLHGGESEFLGGGVKSEDAAAFGAPGCRKAFDEIPAFASLDRSGPLSPAKERPKPKSNRDEEENQRDQWKRGKANIGEQERHVSDNYDTREQQNGTRSRFRPSNTTALRHHLNRS